jgi:glycosyltransferase involved in cell wall biosynthesis
MRILYLTPAFHHPTMRGPTRCYHFAKALARRHAVTLLSLTAEPLTPRALAEMSACCERIVPIEMTDAHASPAARLLARAPGGRRPAAALALRRAVGRMREAFRELVANGSFDVVLFHGKSLFPVIEGFDALPIVVDFCDATSLRVRQRMEQAGVAKRSLLALRWLQVRRVERQLLAKSRDVVFVSRRDAEAILGEGDDGEVVSIGVDHARFRRSRPGATNALVFSGIMSYGPNEDAALVLLDQVFPLVRRAVPDAELFIVGRDPSRRLRARAAETPGATVTGFVPDVRPWLERAAVAAVPMRQGSGVQNKVLEAMAMELPVVTTSLVSAGLRVAGGEAPVLVADEVREFADAVVKLLGQEQERARLAGAGRRFVEEHYDWSRSAARLERICVAAAARARD